MAPIETAVAAPSKLDAQQTLRASTALLTKISSDAANPPKTAAPKTSLLADADEQDAEDETPVWLVLTTKKHMSDKKRLKPGKIVLPHPYLNLQDEGFRICLITADPQRKYKDIVDSPGFPEGLKKCVTRVLGLEKVKARYKSFESRRQLLGEYDVFLADDRVITHLPKLLGKVFYKGGSKRPVPVNLQGKRQSVDEQGVKRIKLSEGGSKVVKNDLQPKDLAAEIDRAVRSALVHLAPSTTTAVKVGRATMEAEHLVENVNAVVTGLVDKYVPQQWKNVRSVHIKGPNTAALPIYMAEELWVEDGDVLEEPLPVKEKGSKKRKRGALADGAEENGVMEVPGPDGKMRKLTAPAAKSKKAKNELVVEDDSAAVKETEKKEKKARKEALTKQKEEAKAAADSTVIPASKVSGEGKKLSKKTRVKPADLI
ncbi:proteasome-interacting protein cic1 [Elasticomyces elasticus]|nr:proteasome-interacting protein cic1 [Elasticomyces elasticus]